MLADNLGVNLTLAIEAGVCVLATLLGLAYLSLVRARQSL